MNRTAIAMAAVAALSSPAFASGRQQAHEAAPAQRAKLVTSVQAELGVEPADGKMGPRTHAALRKFQRAKGLDANGQLDTATVTALGLGGPKPSSDAGRAVHMSGKPSTPIGPSQPSEERAAEPMIKHSTPTGG